MAAPCEKLIALTRRAHSSRLARRLGEGVERVARMRELVVRIPFPPAKSHERTIPLWTYRMRHRVKLVPQGGGHRELTSQLSQCNNGPTQRVTTFLDRAGNAIKGHGVLLAAAPTAATAPGAAATNFCRIIAVPPPVEG